MRRQTILCALAGRSPWIAFFAGFLLASAALSLLGSLAGSTPAIERFVRFHRYINPEGLYYATASQVTALARNKARSASVLVIVGGDSIFYGTGQSTRGVWTQALQAELGSGYSVINLAFPSGGYQEHGAVAAQALLKEGYDVVFVGDVFPGYAVRPDGYQYPYVFWDAYYKGLLLRPEERLEDVEREYDDSGQQGALIELQARYRLDSLLRFNDLWNYVAYNYVFTVWNQLAAGESGNFLLPRRVYPDPADTFTLPPVEVRFPPSLKDSQVQTLRALGERGCERGGAGTVVPYEASAFWQHVRTLNQEALPAELRERSLLVLNYWSSVYRKELTPEEQGCFMAAYANMARALADVGYQVLQTGSDFSDEDYYDRLHLTDAGGAKLAKELAPAVRALAGTPGHDEARRN